MLDYTKHFPKSNELAEIDLDQHKQQLLDLLSFEITQDTVDIFLEKWSKLYWTYNDHFIIVNHHEVIDGDNPLVSRAYHEFSSNERTAFNDLYMQLLEKFKTSGVKSSDEFINDHLTDIPNKAQPSIVQKQRDALHSLRKLEASSKVMYQNRAFSFAKISALIRQENDRELRKEAWTALNSERVAFSSKHFEAFYGAYKATQELAIANGYKNHLEAYWQQTSRDFTPEESLAWSGALLEKIQPVLSHLNDIKKEHMGIKTIKPWDTNPTLYRQVKHGDLLEDDDYVDIAVKALGTISSDFAQIIEAAFQYGSLNFRRSASSRSRRYAAFVFHPKKIVCFTDSNGHYSDLSTVFHELGHGLHYTYSLRNNHDYWSVAPETMLSETVARLFELIGMSIFEDQVGEKELTFDMKFSSLYKSMNLIEMMHNSDIFQHWLYGNMVEKDINVFDAYYECNVKPVIADWSGYETIIKRKWALPADFRMALRTVDYSIAQTVPFTLIKHFWDDPRSFSEKLKVILGQGRRITLSEIVRSFGYASILSSDILDDGMAVLSELAYGLD